MSTTSLHETSSASSVSWHKRLFRNRKRNSRSRHTIEDRDNTTEEKQNSQSPCHVGNGPESHITGDSFKIAIKVSDGEDGVEAENNNKEQRVSRNSSDQLLDELTLLSTLQYSNELEIRNPQLTGKVTQNLIMRRTGKDSESGRYHHSKETELLNNSAGNGSNTANAPLVDTYHAIESNRSIDFSEDGKDKERRSPRHLSPLRWRRSHDQTKNSASNGNAGKTSPSLVRRQSISHITISAVESATDDEVKGGGAAATDTSIEMAATMQDGRRGRTRSNPKQDEARKRTFSFSPRRWRRSPVRSSTSASSGTASGSTHAVLASTYSPSRSPTSRSIGSASGSTCAVLASTHSPSRFPVELARKTSVSTQITLKASNSKESLDASSENGTDQGLGEEVTSAKVAGALIDTAPTHYVHQHHRGRQKRHPQNEQAQKRQSDVWSTLLYKVMKDKHGIDHGQYYPSKDDPKTNRDVIRNSETNVSTSLASILTGKHDCGEEGNTTCSTTARSCTTGAPSGTSHSVDAHTSRSSSACSSGSSSKSSFMGESAFVTNREDLCFADGGTGDCNDSTDTGSPSGMSNAATRSLASLLADVRYPEGAAEDRTAYLLEQQLLKGKIRHSVPSNGSATRTNGSQTGAGTSFASILKPVIATSCAIQNPSTINILKNDVNSSSPYSSPPASTGDTFKQWISNVRCSPFTTHNQQYNVSRGQHDNEETPFSLLAAARKKPRGVKIILEPCESVSSQEDSNSDSTKERQPNIEVFRKRTRKPSGCEERHESSETSTEASGDGGSRPSSFQWTGWMPCGPIPTSRRKNVNPDGKQEENSVETPYSFGFAKKKSTTLVETPTGLEQNTPLSHIFIPKKSRDRNNNRRLHSENTPNPAVTIAKRLEEYQKAKSAFKSRSENFDTNVLHHPEDEKDESGIPADVISRSSSISSTSC